MVDNVSAEQAFAALQADPRSRIVDVRTPTEWAVIGVPALEGMAEPVMVSWSNEQGRVDPGFVDKLAAAGLAPDQPLYMLCRSGVRSIAGGDAALAAGYERVFNIVDGFEGPPDATGRRGQVAGWQAVGLPWIK